MAVGDVEPVRLFQDAVDIHRLRHDAPEILPHGERDPLALFRCLLGEGAFEIGQRAFVPAIERRHQPPDLGRDRACDIDREQPHESDQEPQHGIFQPVLQIAKETDV